MRRTGMPLVPLLSLLTCWGVASNADLKSDRHEIARQYQQYSNAFKAKDAKKLMGFVTNDVVIKSIDGKLLNYDQFHEELHRLMDRVQTVIEFRVKIDKLSVKGDHALVIAHVSIILQGSDETGKKHLVRDDGSTKDNWTRVGKAWLINRSEETSAHSTLDGKTTSKAKVKK